MKKVITVNKVTFVEDEKKENIVCENGYFDKVLQVRFTLNELLEIHKLLSNEIDRVDIYKANELMKTAKSIEKKTSKYIAWA